MKTAAISSIFFAGLALAVPAVKQQKRELVTNVVVKTVWTTTTIYVDPTAKAANFVEQPKSAAPAASSAAATPAPVVAQSAAPAASVAAPVAQVVQAAAVPAASAAAVAAPASGSGPSGTGEATWYDVSVGLGSCGLPQASNSDPVVALSIPKMANGANPNANPRSGKTIVINYNGATHQGKVYDTCEGCASGNIDLSTGFFKTVFPTGDGRVSGVSWYVV